MGLNKYSYSSEDLDKGYIYLILNLKNNKSYVGKTFYPRKRYSDHIKQNDQLIDKEIDKYGKENFLFVIIDEVDKSILAKKELEWIEKTNSYENGYNQKDW